MTLASAANDKIADRGTLCVGAPGAGPWCEALAPSASEGDMAVAVLGHHPGRATRLERPSEPRTDPRARVLERLAGVEPAVLGAET